MESILGFEIAEESLKILEMRSSENGWEVLHLDKLDLPPETVQEGIILEPKLIAVKLSTFLKANSIATKRAVVLVNPPFVFSRLIRMPHNFSDEQILENLEAEVNQYKNFSGKNNIIDFRPIEEISEEGVKKLNVLFAVTLKELADSYSKTMQLTGLDLLGIDVPIFSIMRLLDGVDFHPSSLEATLLMLIGVKSLEICIMKGSRPRFLHSVQMDLRDFENNKDIFAERIASSIKLVVNFYQARFIQGEQIARVIIAPEEARFGEVPELLQDKLGHLPIQMAGTLKKVLIDNKENDLVDKLRFNYCALLGATLRLSKPESPFNLNFLRGQRSKKQQRLNQIQLLLVILSFVFGLMLLYFGWIALKINILQLRMSRIKLQLQQPNPDLGKIISAKEKKNLIDNQLQEASVIIANNAGGIYFNNIAKAMSCVVNDLKLEDIAAEKEPNRLVLSGEALTEKAIFDYKSSLEDSRYFNSVELVSSVRNSDKIKFVIKCTIK